MTFVLTITIASLLGFTGLELAFPRSARKTGANLRHSLENLLFAGIAIGTSQGAYALIKDSISFPRLWSAADHLPVTLEIVVCVLFFDLVSWLWHWSNHHVGILWRSHAVHHSDTLLNASSALRFHTFELFPSLIIRGILAAALGFSAEALMVFNGLYVVMNFFEHSHLRLPESFERFLSLIFITPSLHHLHHSTDFKEQNLNLGTIFSFWDRVFGYQMRTKRERIDYGVIPQQLHLTIWQTLKLPFKSLR